MTRQVLVTRQTDAKTRNLALHTALDPAPAAGSLPLAEHLAANLVDNALRHNVPGGRVNVNTGMRNSRAFLLVLSTGPAVPAAALDRLFQRLDADRTSRGECLGLGLSIVQAIADAHNATITARPQPAGGLLVDVTFPEPGRHDPRSPVTGVREPPPLPSGPRRRLLPAWILARRRAVAHPHARAGSPVALSAPGSG